MCEHIPSNAIRRPHFMYPNDRNMDAWVWTDHTGLPKAVSVNPEYRAKVVKADAMRAPAKRKGE